jgi:hypothetical protein
VVERIERKWDACSCTASHLVSASSPDQETKYTKGLIPRMNRLLVYKAPFIVPFVYSVLLDKPRKAVVRKHIEFEADDDLKPGDVVVIRSENEINSTLDESGKFKGLLAMPEMTKFYGQEHRVFKKINRIMFEATGEMKTIKSPTYLLEGVFCDGGNHNRCERSCFLLWKREWLKKV